jgi:hypothetical protein
VYGDASDKSFSIVYLNKNNKERTLDLIAPSPDIFKLWFGGLKSLVKKLQEQRQNYSLDALYLKSLWDRADADHSGSLSSKEIVSLISSINVNLPLDKVKAMYKKFDVDQNGTLDFHEFIEFMGFLRKRYFRCLSVETILIYLHSSDLEAIWKSIVASETLCRPIEHLTIDLSTSYSKDSVISLDQFIKFWCVYLI